MTELNLESRILKTIQKNYLDSIQFTKTQVRIDGVLKKDLSSLISEPSVLKEAKAGDYAFLEEEEKKRLARRVTVALKKSLIPKIEDPFPKTKIDPSLLIPFLDLESEADYYMLSVASGWLSTVTFKSWKELIPEEARKEYMKTKKIGIIRYQPYSLTKYELTESDDASGQYYIVNSCVQPDWRYRSDKSEIASIFKEFIESLFSTKESLRYALAWIYEAIYGRNATYLVLNGRKGIGKNILATACSKMVGTRNYVEAPRSALTKEFNTYLKDKRLVLMDEISFRDNKEKDKLKSYLNDRQSVEGKGKDAKMIDLYCSIILSSNTDKDCNIEPDDRRFSVMDLCETPLLQSLGSEGIAKLVEYIESEDFPLAFNSYLEENMMEDYNPNEPFKGETFNRLCLSSLKVWQLAIYEAVTSKEKEGYIIKDIMTPETMEFFPKRFNDYENFLNNFTVEGKYLGRFEREQTIKDSVIYPSKDFKPEEGEDLE
jgi:hypothetical protein